MRALSVSQNAMAGVYVIGPFNGTYKIGYASEPEWRTAQQGAGKIHNLAIVAVIDGYDFECWEAERYAHWLLRDRARGGETFEVSSDEAVSAVRYAMLAVRQGDKAADAKARGRLETLHITASSSTADLIREMARNDGVAPNDILNEAVALLLARREAFCVAPSALGAVQ